MLLPIRMRDPERDPEELQALRAANGESRGRDDATSAALLVFAVVVLTLVASMLARA